MPRVHTVKKARKDFPEFGIKKGDSYYYWGFAFGPSLKSKTYPRRDQLTRSGFLIDLYQLEDNLEFDRDDLETSVQDLVGRIEELRDQCQDSLDNMPEHLQETSESGMLLQERIEALESWISDLEGVDLEVDVELSEEEVARHTEDWKKDFPDGDEVTLASFLDGVLEAKKDERIEEIIEELQGLNSGL